MHRGNTKQESLESLMHSKHTQSITGIYKRELHSFPVNLLLFFLKKARDLFQRMLVVCSASVLQCGTTTLTVEGSVGDTGEGVIQLSLNWWWLTGQYSAPWGGKRKGK